MTEKRIVERGTMMKVLNEGYVRLIDFMGNDESIVEAARMSTGRGFISWDPYQRCKKCDLIESLTGKFESFVVAGREGGYPSEHEHDWEKFPNGDMGLLDNLWRNKHGTPFEMVEMVIEVQAPIMVFREWHRHRTESYNEFSARYAQMPNLHYVPELERIQKQSKSNKQGSAEAFPEEQAEAIRMEIIDQQGEVYDSYDDWVDQGLAKEIARINTPVSRYSKMRAKANLRNWFQFLNLRMRPTAQWEIRQYALEVSQFINWVFPKSHSLFEEYDLYGVHFSRTEMEVLRGLISDLTQTFDFKGLTGTKLKEFHQKLSEGGIKILG